MEENSSATNRFIEALQTFGPQHPQRNRIEGAQRTTLENLVSTSESLKKFNIESDVVFTICSEAFQQHIQLLSQIKRELTALETRVTSAKMRAVQLAEHDGVDLSFLDTPSAS